MGALLQNFVNRYVWDTSERRSLDELHTINGSILQSILSGDNFTDEPVTIRKALRISTVFTCTNVIGRTISSLPINIMKEEGGKKFPLTDHRAYYPLAHEPNSYMSSANFFLTLMLHANAWGNGYAHINRDSRMNPVSFDIMEPWETDVSIDKGNLFYHYQGESYPSRDVIHFRWYSWDGICGKSPILENANTMGMAIKLDRFSALTLSARPPGILSYKGNLTPEQRAENKKNWQQGSQDQVKVLSGDWAYDPIMTQPEAAQFVQAKNLNQREIYGIYQIPPTFAQNFERATYSNAEQSDLVYAKHTIMPIIRMMEQELNMKLFFEREKANTYVKFSLNGLLRGDIAARKEFYQSMVNTGVMNRNEARSLEDMNPYKGGDDFLVQGAMVPADMLREKMEKELIPSAPAPGIKEKINGHSFVN